MAKAFDFIQKKNVSLVTGQLSNGAFERDSQRRMRGSCAGFGARGFLRLFMRHFLLAHATAARVVAGIDENPERPGGETRLAAKARNAALNFHESILDGVFGVACCAEQIAGDALHSRAVEA